MHSNNSGNSIVRRAAFFAAFFGLSILSQPALAETGKELLKRLSDKAEKSTPSKAPTKDDAAPTGKKVEVWELKQTSKLVGPINCLISPEAVRIRAEKMGITWMFKAPQWDAYLFNTETKNFCTFPYAVWKDKVFFMPSNKTTRAKSEIQQMKVAKTGKTQQIGGAPAYEVALTRTTGAKYGEIWMASNIVAPKQFSEVVGSMVMVPIKTGGTPLRAAMFQQRAGKIVQVFDTNTVAKKTVDSSMFEPLKGYNKVKDEMALLFAESPDGGGGMFDSGGSSSLKNSGF